MAPEQESEPLSPVPEASQAPPARRRGRRGGRGRRGRGRPSPQQESQEALPQAEPAVESEADVVEPTPVVSEAPPPPPRAIQPASPQAVQQAIEEVNRIIETLRGTLDDMDLVLETLELAERQKNADEQEIETLRRGLRHLHRPREGGEHSHHH